MDTAAAKKRIEAACEKKLNSLFPHGIPEVVSSRYQEELELMAETGSVELYPEQQVVPLGMDVTAWKGYEERSVQPFQANRGFLLLPKGKTIEDYRECMLRLKSGEPCFSLSLASDVIRRDHMKSVRISDDRRLEQIGRMERITGISRDDIRYRNGNTIRWQDLFNVTERPRDRFLVLNLRPETFSKIIEAKTLDEGLCETYSYAY